MDVSQEKVFPFYTNHMMQGFLEVGPCSWAMSTATSNTLLACLHDQNKNGFFGGPAFFSQSEFFKNLQIVLIGWIKASPPKKATFVLYLLLLGLGFLLPPLKFFLLTPLIITCLKFKLSNEDKVLRKSLTSQ